MRVRRGRGGGASVTNLHPELTAGGSRWGVLCFLIQIDQWTGRQAGREGGEVGGLVGGWLQEQRRNVKPEKSSHNDKHSKTAAETVNTWTWM